MPYDPTRKIGIEQQRKLAQALRDQSMEPIKGNGAPISFTQGLAKMLQAYKGKQGLEAADQKEKDLLAQKRSEQAQLLRGIGMSDAQADMYGNEPEIGLAAWQMEQRRADKIAAAQAAERTRIRNLKDQEAMRIRVEQQKQGLAPDASGKLNYIPGSIGEGKFKTKIAEDFETTKRAIADGQRVLRNAEKIIGIGVDEQGNPNKPHPGFDMATGTTSYLTRLMPAETDAAQAATRIKEMKEQMQAVGKNMMPGLGSMAVQEWPKVEALISQIDPTADASVVKEKVENAVKAFAEFTNIAKTKYNAKYGDRLDQYPEFKIESDQPKGGAKFLGFE